ncbi:MAG: NADPH-dependent FMN reductase [Halobacteriota archaeon]
MEQPTVLGIAGSLREESHSHASLQYALEGASSAGASVTDVDLRQLDLPVYNPDASARSAEATLTTAVQAADAILVATPVYHGSYSSTIKNAIDYCGFDEFENKTVGLLAVAGGRYPITALEHLRLVFRSLNAWVLPYQAAVPRASHVFDGAELTDRELRERLETLGEKAVQFAHIRHLDPRSLESQENVGG